jgi:hypothetical protein
VGLGRRDESNAVMRGVQTKYAGAWAYQIAQSYALRGDKDAAFTWLDRAFENREAVMTVMRGDWILRNLRDDPRYTALLIKMKLDDPHLAVPEATHAN